MSKGGFMKDALILFVITLISGFLLGAVYQITKAPIQMAEAKESLHKYQEAYPDATDFTFDQAIQDQVDISKETLAAEKPEYGNVAVNVALKAVDASGNTIGHIVTASSDDSYGGTVKVSVGITLDGAITGVEILEINDTPGRGMKAVAYTHLDVYKRQGNQAVRRAEAQSQKGNFHNLGGHSGPLCSANRAASPSGGSGFGTRCCDSRMRYFSRTHYNWRSGAGSKCRRDSGRDLFSADADRQRPGYPCLLYTSSCV